MGCFNIQGDISQLPIFYGDRVAGILCKIDSGQEYPTHKFCIGEYELKPMCPIIYGEYDDYGGIQNLDDSNMLTILKEFFEQDINIIMKDFASIRTFGCDNDSLEHLHNLIDKKDNSKIRWRKDEKIEMDDDERRKLFITNNFYLVIEHESVVKQIIKEFEIVSKKDFQFYIYKQPDWNKLYDIQLNIVKKYNLDKYNTVLDFEKRFEIEKYINESKVSFLFPSNTLYLMTRDLFKSEDGLMYLFREYPEMWKYNFDTNLKSEYLDTLKFYKGLKCMQMHMFINRDYGSQWQNTKGWKRLLKTYKKINDDRLNLEKEWEDDE